MWCPLMDVISMFGPYAKIIVEEIRDLPGAILLEKV